MGTKKKLPSYQNRFLSAIFVEKENNRLRSLLRGDRFTSRQPLLHRMNVASFPFFYLYIYRRYLDKLPSLLSFIQKFPLGTHFPVASEQHPFFHNILHIRWMIHSNIFFPRISARWINVSRGCLSSSYSLGNFKCRFKKCLTLTKFELIFCCPLCDISLLHPQH